MAVPNQQIDEKTCFTLVGQFLRDWALMEMQLNDVIGAALELNGAQKFIVCSNIQFRDKIHIARTAVDIATARDKAEHYKSELVKLGKFTTERNMVAHDVFGVSDDRDGVIFLVTQAKGRLKFPEIVWTKRDFEKRQQKMDAFTQMLVGLVADMKQHAQTVPLAKALASPT